MDTTDRRTYR